MTKIDIPLAWLTAWLTAYVCLRHPPISFVEIMTMLVSLSLALYLTFRD